MKKALSEFRDLMRTVPPLVVSLLFLSIVGMNLLANKSINTGVEWLALDCGILFSWLTFLCMDILTQGYGPGVWGESFVEGSEDILNTALNNTFGGTWFIILGSSVAFLVSAALNNFLNDGIGRKLRRDRGFGSFALRAYVSTFVAQFADNLVFALLVSKVFFGWTLLQCFTCALTGAGLELLFEVFFSPLGYSLSRGLFAKRPAPQAA